jgi:hypothetical protein
MGIRFRNERVVWQVLAIYWPISLKIPGHFWAISFVRSIFYTDVLLWLASATRVSEAKAVVIAADALQAGPDHRKCGAGSGQERSVVEGILRAAIILSSFSISMRARVVINSSISRLASIFTS